ncbi:MAG: glycoside hydrolase family 92 protein, partial [bacterium]
YPGVMYSDLSMWDTFRAEHPLLIFLEPEKVSEMIRGLLNAYDQGGWIPKFPSPGYSNVMFATHGDSVIADAYIKGIRGFDADKAYEGILKDASVPGDRGYEARNGILDYVRLGYVPANGNSESVASTLEYAYDDFCIAQMAKALGRNDDYGMLMKRALNYENVFDPETKLIRMKNSSGAWGRPDDQNISVWARGTERDLKVYKWNYTLFVPQDPQGIMNFLGGAGKFVEFLDNFFGENLYYVGDEFSMHSPYLYNFAGAPWKTQKQVRGLLDYYFAAGPGGQCGNDDAGQLSAWYVFGAMGFYPVSPGLPAYQISGPVFDKVTMHLANGKTFVVEARNNSKTNVYIQSASLNGISWSKPWFEHKDIMAGGKLELTMGPEPNKAWGSDMKAMTPLSISKPSDE